MLDPGRALFARQHPTARWAWKDPRTSLTLPFWLRALEVRPVIVLCLRNPLEACRSLQQRNHVDKPTAVALWERYLQTILRSAEGLPVLIGWFDAILDDPVAFAERARRALELDTPSQAALDRFVEPRLRNHTIADLEFERDGEVSTQQVALLRSLRELPQWSEAFRWGSPVSETPRTEQLFAQLRAHYRLLTPTQPRRRTRPAVSVVLVSRDEGEALRQTVAATAMTVPRSAEIIVVDDASTDGSAAALRGWSETVRVIRLPSRMGVARARNAGAAASRADMIVFSDAHVAPAEGWFELMTEAASWPEVGAVGPTLTPFSGGAVGRGLTFCDQVLNLRWMSDGGELPFPVPLLCGCFMMMRRRVFDRVGGFDEQFAPYGGEDLELCVRLWRFGYQCLVEPRAVVAHRFRVRPFDDEGLEHAQYNLMRLGSLHLSRSKLTALTQALHGSTVFPAALARVIASDLGHRRQQIDGRATVDGDWFFERFGLSLFPEPDDLER
jgi:hypothetical protein